MKATFFLTLGTVGCLITSPLLAQRYGYQEPYYEGEGYGTYCPPQKYSSPPVYEDVPVESHHYGYDERPLPLRILSRVKHSFKEAVGIGEERVYAAQQYRPAQQQHYRPTPKRITPAPRYATPPLTPAPRYHPPAPPQVTAPPLRQETRDWTDYVVVEPRRNTPDPSVQKPKLESKLESKLKAEPELESIRDPRPTPQRDLKKTTVPGEPKVKPTPEPEPLEPTTASDPLPYAAPVPGKNGYVYSPYREGKMVDVSGIAPGTTVEDPYTKEHFLVP